jgi:hypothetical protein
MGWHGESDAVLGSCFSFFDGPELPDSYQVPFSSHCLLSDNYGIKTQHAEFAIRRVHAHRVAQNCFVISNTFYLSQAIELSQVSLHIQVPESAAQLVSQVKGKLVCRKPVVGMDVFNRRLNTVKVFGRHSAAYIKVERYKAYAVEDAAHASNDDELHLLLLQSQQQSLVILSHEESL